MSKIWWFVALKRIEKIILKNAFGQKKKKPGLKFNPGLAVIGLRTTGPFREGRERLVSPLPLNHRNKWKKKTWFFTLRKPILVIKDQSGLLTYAKLIVLALSSLVLTKVEVLQHVREFKTVWDSGFHAMDSGLQVLDSGFLVSGSWIGVSNR